MFGLFYIWTIVVTCQFGFVLSSLLRWMTVRRYTGLVFSQLLKTTQPGQPSVGRHRV